MFSRSLNIQRTGGDGMIKQILDDDAKKTEIPASMRERILILLRKIMQKNEKRE